VIRLVATDLDGTLLRSDGGVSRRTRAALDAVRARGTDVVVVTGRPPRWLRGMADLLGHGGLAICANGALVVDLDTGDVAREFPMAAEAARRMAEALREVLPDVAFAVERRGGFAREPAYRPRWPNPDETIHQLDELLAEPVHKLLVRHEELGADELLAIAHGAAESIVTPTHSSREGLLEVSAFGVTKAATLALLAAERGVDPAGVVAFGDMPNDLPMLEWAGRGVAVANAHPDVLAAADEVTASNDDDGVAAVLEAL
jgi:Cof subfamily protein (haloacid dehalogenase superfamily)